MACLYPKYYAFDGERSNHPYMAIYCLISTLWKSLPVVLPKGASIEERGRAPSAELLSYSMIQFNI